MWGVFLGGLDAKFGAYWDQEPRRDELCESHNQDSRASHNSVLRNERFIEKGGPFR